MAPEDTIAERRRAEEALLESAEKLRALLGTASQGVVISDGQGRVVFVNPLAEEKFGYRRDELLGQPFDILIPEGIREEHAGHRAEYLSSPRVRLMGPGLNLVGQRKDGTQFPLDCGLSFVQTEDGILVMALIIDITERKRAEEELRESEERFRLLFESAFEAIAIHENGVITDINPAFENLFGYSHSELVGMHVTQLAAEESRDLVTRMVRTKSE